MADSWKYLMNIINDNQSLPSGHKIFNPHFLLKYMLSIPKGDNSKGLSSGSDKM